MTTPLGGALGLVLYVSAAVHAATREQTHRLREEVMPVLRQHYAPTGDERPVLDGVRAIMGDDWVPGPQWQEYLDKVGRNEKGELRATPQTQARQRPPAARPRGSGATEGEQR